MDETFGSMARQMSKMLEQLNKGYYNFYPSESWTPNVNLYETDRAYLVCVDLAGVDQKKIEIEVIDRRLSIKGTRSAPVTEAMNPAGTSGRAKARVHLMEIDHGAFARIVELPLHVEAEKISAQHKNGLLWIEIPKK